MRLAVVCLLTCLTAVGIAGCIRVKPAEKEAQFPVAPALEKAEGADGVVPSEKYQVKFETSKGDVVIEVYPEWAPRGAARFRELVEGKFFEETRFFRIVPGFVVQWGIHGDPQVQAKWSDSNIEDDPVKTSNARGTITFATSGPNSRTTQLFINLGNNASSLDGQGFSPFGKVIQGMDVIDALNAEYRERPDQGNIQQQGNAYLNRVFPNLDYIKKSSLIEVKPEVEAPAATAAEMPTEAASETKNEAKSETKTDSPAPAAEKSDAAKPETTPPAASKPEPENAAPVKPVTEKAEPEAVKEAPKSEPSAESPAAAPPAETPAPAETAAP